MSEAIRVLELYSGIGGMHYALCESGIKYDVVQAIDLNVNTNKVYKHNFPDTPVSASSISGLKVKDLEEMKVDMILMSPPCQPFTRIGNQKDEDDVRTGSFFHFLKIFKKIAKHPSYILLENVKGFESSKTRMQLIETLTECGYNYQEMLLTPKQFGIPNCRLRYYLLAILKPLQFTFKATDEVMTSLPDIPREWLPHKIAAEMSRNSTDLKEELTCICQGHFINNTNNRSCVTEQLKRPFSDSDILDVKRLKPDCSETVGQVQSNMSDETVESDSSKIANNNAVRKVNNNREEHLDIRHDKETDKTVQQLKGDQGEREPVNCLENYGLLLRLPEEDRDLTDGLCLNVGHFLEADWQNTGKFEKYLVPKKFFKQLVPMDILNPCTRKTACFTKRYGRYVTGGGSLLLMTTDIEVVERANNLKEHVMEKLDRDTWGDKEMEIIDQLKTRYFTPREVANIMCFPKSFNFIGEFTDKQNYSMLGNSLNVHVVSVLIKLLTNKCSFTVE